MSKLYAMSWAEEIPKNPKIDAAFKWSLPAVKCSVCKRNLWKNYQYPCVELPARCNGIDYTSPEPSTLERFEVLKDNLGPSVCAEYVIAPGTSFGPLEGRTIAGGVGSIGDFAWVFVWTALIKASLAELFASRGVSIEAGATNVVGPNRKTIPYLALQARPLPALAKSFVERSTVRTCLACGRRDLKFSGLPVLDSSFVPLYPIFCIAEVPEILVVRQDFRKVALDENLKDVKFEELPCE